MKVMRILIDWLSSLNGNAIVQMISKLRFITFVLILISFSSCKSWLAFDAARMLFGFVFTLVIAIVGLIIMIASRKNKK